MSRFLSPLFAPGFFQNATVHTALIVGVIVSVVAGVVGTFTVLRGQSFAGHAFGDVGTMGGSGANLIGMGTLWGFLIAGVAGAFTMEFIGVQRTKGRDLATGIVLGAALGLSALFLYLGTIASSTTGATVSILFGSIFAVPTSTIPLATVFGVISLVIVAALYRPLLLSSVSTELAAARGIPVRALGAAYLLALAVAVALTALTIGTILATALLIGPAATALRLTKSPGRAILLAVTLSLATTCVGIVLAYDSFLWPPAGGWPVSFFVVTLVLAVYLLAGVPDALRRRSGRSPQPHQARWATAREEA